MANKKPTRNTGILFKWMKDVGISAIFATEFMFLGPVWVLADLLEGNDKLVDRMWKHYDDWTGQ